MGDRIVDLETLARLKASGEITVEEFTSRKAEILASAPLAPQPETMSDDDAQWLWGKFIGLIGMALGVALYYFNGWAITKTNALYIAADLSFFTDLGFFVGPYQGAFGAFVDIGDGWLGLARTKADALLIDAPLINVIGLVAAWVFMIEGFKAFVWPERHQDKVEQA